LGACRVPPHDRTHHDRDDLAGTPRRRVRRAAPVGAAADRYFAGLSLAGNESAAQNGREGPTPQRSARGRTPPVASEATRSPAWTRSARRAAAIAAVQIAAQGRIVLMAPPTERLPFLLPNYGSGRTSGVRDRQPVERAPQRDAARALHNCVVAVGVALPRSADETNAIVLATCRTRGSRPRTRLHHYMARQCVCKASSSCWLVCPARRSRSEDIPRRCQ
jgi:hypothetical protein